MKSTKKLCWDVLEHIILMPALGSNSSPRMLYYNDVLNMEGCEGEFFESEEPCIECNKYFLKKKTYISGFCSDRCKQINKEKNTISKGPDKRLRNNGGGYQNLGKQAWNRGLKTGMPDKCASYENYRPLLEWFVEVRQDPKDTRILQTKCCICGKWHRPSRNRIILVLNYVNGLEGKETWGFYCSNACKQLCPHFGKSVTTIIKEDYLKYGKAKYSEVNNISEKILYYDWQEDLKKIQNKLKTSLLKKQERRKLRRRKKTETEKRRMIKKQIKKKLLEDPRTPRLKRMLYLSKQRAKQRGLEYNLNFEWLLENITEKCPKCNVVFDFNMERNMNPWAPSIDRIDSSKGYTKDNCIITSWIYNCGKSSYDEETLYIICKAYLKNLDHDTT